MRVIPDENQPSAAIEIPLERGLPDYDLGELDKATPREVDAILVTQGFRDLVDDARGILTDLVEHPPMLSVGVNHSTLDLTGNPHFEIAQVTGAICPGDEVYRPGLWIVLRDPKGTPNQPLGKVKLEHARVIVEALVRKLGL